MTYDFDNTLEYFKSFFQECIDSQGELKYLREIHNNYNGQQKYLFIDFLDIKNWNPAFAEYLQSNLANMEKIAKEALILAALNEKLHTFLVEYLLNINIVLRLPENEINEHAEEHGIHEKEFSIKGHVTGLKKTTIENRMILYLSEAIETTVIIKIPIEMETNLLTDVGLNDYVLITGKMKMKDLKKGKIATVNYIRRGVTITKDSDVLVRLTDDYIKELLKEFPEDKDALYEISKKILLFERENLLKLPKSHLNAQLIILSFCRFYVSPKYEIDKYLYFFSTKSSYTKEELKKKCGSLRKKFLKHNIESIYQLIDYEHNIPFLSKKIAKQLDFTTIELMNRFPDIEESLSTIREILPNLIEQRVFPIYHITLSIDSIFFILLQAYFPVKKDFEQYKNYFYTKHNPLIKNFKSIIITNRNELKKINFIEEFVKEFIQKADTQS